MIHKVDQRGNKRVGRPLKHRCRIQYQAFKWAYSVHQIAQLKESQVLKENYYRSKKETKQLKKKGEKEVSFALITFSSNIKFPGPKALTES